MTDIRIITDGGVIGPADFIDVGVGIYAIPDQDASLRKIINQYD